jgi:hypothetical protein
MKLGLMSVLRGKLVSKPILDGIIVTPVSNCNYRNSIRHVYKIYLTLISNEVELPAGNILYPFQDSYAILNK